jgi:hypothetical protein
MTSKSGKSQELADLIDAKAVPILKQQRGFVDEIVLVAHTEPDRVLALSFGITRKMLKNISAITARRFTMRCGTYLRLNRTFKLSTSILRSVTTLQGRRQLDTILT